MQLKNIESFWSTFFQKGRGVLGQRPKSSSADDEIFLPAKNQDGRGNGPVDCFLVGDPIRGSPKGRHRRPLISASFLEENLTKDF